jgi:hypothetical protein
MGQDDLISSSFLPQGYSAQIPAEKRKLLNMVYSNSTWAGGELAPNYRKPFDMIAVYNQAYQREKATNPKKSDLFDIWRPLPDLNRCRRRERAVSQLLFYRGVRFIA